MKHVKKSERLKIKLLYKLRSNSQDSLAKISRKIKTPVTTVFEAEKTLKRQGIITRYYSAIDFEKAGFPIRATFMLKLSEEALDTITDKLMKNIHINNLQLLEGNHNLLAEAVFRNMPQFLNFKAQLKIVNDAFVYYVLEELKTEDARIS